MPFHLNAGPYLAGNLSGLHFSTDVMDLESEEDLNLFFNIFFTSCKELKPVFGGASEAEFDPGVYMYEAEYYRNPYFFCAEQPVFRSSGFNPKFLINFLHDKGLAAKLAEIETKMNRSELVEILGRHSKRVVVGDDGGIGVLKDYPLQIYPRFFVRREARRKGIALESGIAEKYGTEEYEDWLYAPKLQKREKEDGRFEAKIDRRWEREP